MIHRALRITFGLSWAILGLNVQAKGDVKHCYDCHEKLREAYRLPVVHDPVAKADCETCHKRHGFGNNLVLKDNGPGLCTGCHPNVLKETEQPVVHQAVKEGLCWTCHEPHATRRKGLLREVDGKAACFVCHEELVGADRQASRHEPFGREACSECHLAHAGEREFLLRQPSDSLCATCHDTRAKSFVDLHPAAVGGLSCITCHDAHSSGDPALLSGGLHGAMKDGDCSGCHSSPTPQSGDLTAEDPSLCLSCHSEVQEDLGLKNRHEAAAGPCLACHEPHQSRHQGLLSAAEGDVCKQCHSVQPDTTAQAVSHAPFEEGQCSSCHAPHGSDHEPLLKSAGNALCTSCHSDSSFAAPQHEAAQDCRLCHAPHSASRLALLKESQETMCTACHEIDDAAATIHAPYEAGNCVYCHAPHSSPEPHLTRAKPEQLCLTCHVDIQRFLASPSQHEPAAECLSCHAAHGSDQKSLLLVNSSETCSGCHPSDPVPAGGVTHAPYAKGDCAGCHNPHGALQPGLLGPRRATVVTPMGEMQKYPVLDSTRASLCRTCHGETMKSWDSSAVVHSPVAAGQCETCHDPHVGAPGLLSGPVYRLCAGCHEAGPSFVSKHSGADVTRSNCMDCHNPHASGSRGLLNANVHAPFSDGDCGVCHQAAAGTESFGSVDSALCLQCHDAYGPGSPGFLHQPVRAGECTACHSPHASAKPNMLRQDGAELCGNCHDDFKSRAVPHEPVAQGLCLACHPAHRSEGSKLLTSSGNQLCLGCHEELAGRLATEQVHAPVAKNCQTCHDPHGAALPTLLSSEQSELCGSCHPRDAAWNASHLKGEIKGKCVECHDPHSVPAGQKALLYAHQHEPFASGDCSACHTDTGTPSSAQCAQCHEVASQASAAKHPHPPVAEGACLACHRAHAGPVPNLLKGSGPKTCGSCHESQIKPVLHEHPPASECETCHQAHGGERPGLLGQASELELCATCHEGSQERHFHPMGDKAENPATGGPLQCSGCHNPHGSSEPMLLLASPGRELCVRCHELSH